MWVKNLKKELWVIVPSSNKSNHMNKFGNGTTNQVLALFLNLLWLIFNVVLVNYSQIFKNCLKELNLMFILSISYILAYASLPPHVWHHALQITTYLLNKKLALESPTKILMMICWHPYVAASQSTSQNPPHLLSFPFLPL